MTGNPKPKLTARAAIDPAAIEHRRPASTLCYFIKLTILIAVFISGVCSAVCAGPLADVFSGQAMFVEDTAFQPPPECRSHAEYTTVHFNGQYHMYFRSFRHSDGSYGDISGIGLATSADGDTWTAYNGGRPVYANRSYTSGSGEVAVVVYAPHVLAEVLDGVPTLTMVYEVMDTGVFSGGAMPRHYIEAARSIDGINWAPIVDGTGKPARILVAQTPWEGFVSGQHRGNAGTPSLHRFGGNYYLFYHGFSGTDGPNCLGRGYAYGPSLTSLTRAAANPVMQAPGLWGNAGTGRGDIIQEAGYYYKVFEGLRYSAFCGPALTGWGLARSVDLNNWEFSPRNPVRIDRVAPGCGEDMPSFQVIGDEVYVVTVTSDIGEIPAVRRYGIIPSPRPITTSEIVAVVARPAGDGYWQVARDGKVYAFGAAMHLGDATLPGDTEAIDIAAHPGGAGYWVALSNGGVRAFGAAVDYGSAEGMSLAQPVKGLVPTPSGNGYWLYAGDGGIFTYGDAPFHGSLGGNPPASPVVSKASRPTGDGYWLLSADGTVYNLGAAPDAGSYTGGGAPAVELVPGTNGNGYWIILQNGNVFTYGAGMGFYGSTGSMMPSPITGASASRAGGSATGYWLTAADGGIIEFGSARYFGDAFFTTASSGIAIWELY